MSQNPLTIAIDGTASSGKGTLATMLALHFDLPYLNTGALYRAIAFKSQLQTNSFAELALSLTPADLENQAIFSEEIGSIASNIAKDQQLRQSLLFWQHQFVANSVKTHNGCVLDGRDTTTVICPQAKYKFFITAKPEIRAKRRHLQLPNSDLATILAQIIQRDGNDFNRSIAPLRVAFDAKIIDNSHLNIKQCFDVALQQFNQFI